MVKKPARPIDAILGRRIKLVREQSKITRQMLATSMGVSPQQIEKYETGKSRIAFSQLIDIAEGLKMAVIPLIAPVVDEKHEPFRATGYLTWLQAEGALKMLEGYSKLRAAQRRAILAFVRSLDGDG